MRHALRVDANQVQVISALESAGAKVQIIGLPVDLLVGYERGTEKRFAFFEVKDGPKKKMTDKQVKFFQAWAGWPICLVDGPETALRHLRVLQG